MLRLEFDREMTIVICCNMFPWYCYESMSSVTTLAIIIITKTGLQCINKTRKKKLNVFCRNMFQWQDIILFVNITS